jgi:hypothetical protein
VFFYYSGHGVVFSGDMKKMCRIVHPDGNLNHTTEIEKLLKSLAMRPNVQLFGILDCCRKTIEKEEKSYIEGEKVAKGGEYGIGFACEIDEVATASNITTGSKYTDAMAKLISSG